MDVCQFKYAVLKFRNLVNEQVILIIKGNGVVIDRQQINFQKQI